MTTLMLDALRSMIENRDYRVVWITPNHQRRKHAMDRFRKLALNYNLATVTRVSDCRIKLAHGSRIDFITPLTIVDGYVWHATNAWELRVQARIRPYKKEFMGNTNGSYAAPIYENKCPRDPRFGGSGASLGDAKQASVPAPISNVATLVKELNELLEQKTKTAAIHREKLTVEGWLEQTRAESGERLNQIHALRSDLREGNKVNEANLLRAGRAEAELKRLTAETPKEQISALKDIIASVLRRAETAERLQKNQKQTIISLLTSERDAEQAKIALRKDITIERQRAIKAEDAAEANLQRAYTAEALVRDFEVSKANA